MNGNNNVSGVSNHDATCPVSGDVETVLAAMHEVKQLRAKGADASHIRIALVLAGGVLRGAYGGGFVTALEDAGYTDVFDTVVGISAGAPTAAYYLAGESRVGTSIFYEECMTRQFFSFARWRSLMSINFLSDVFRGSTGKTLDCERVLQRDTNLVIVVTDKHGVPQYVEPESCEELHQTIAGSCALPFVCTQHHFLNNERVFDGGMGNTLPYNYVTKEFQPTHVLIVANRPKHRRWIGVQLSRLLLWGARTFLFTSREEAAPVTAYDTWRDTKMPPALQFNQNVEKFLADPTIATAVAWTPRRPGMFSRNQRKIQKLASDSEACWKQWLSR